MRLRIMTRVYLRKGLQPARTTRDRLYHADWEKVDNVQKTAQDTDYPRMAHPFENDEHMAGSPIKRHGGKATGDIARYAFKQRRQPVRGAGCLMEGSNKGFSFTLDIGYYLILKKI